MLKSKPKIEFLDKQNTIRFSGIFIIKSYWEEDAELASKIKEFIVGRNKLVLDFALFYLDSVSRKIFFELVVEIKDDLKKIKDLKINWYYDKEDESIYELGDLLTKIIDVPFNFLEKD